MSEAADLLAGYSSEEDENITDNQNPEFEYRDESEDREYEQATTELDQNELSFDSVKSVRFFSDLIAKVDLSEIDSVKSYCNVLPLVNRLVVEVDKQEYNEELDREEEIQFISRANEILDVLSTEISEIFSFIKVHYTPIFPELASLITNPIEYCTIVSIIRDDLNSVNTMNDRLKNVLSGDKMLVVTMSASLLRQNGNSVKLKDHELALIYDSCDLLLQLDNSRSRITSYIAQRSSFIVPNITAIVGPIVAAQLISVHGLEGLTKTPSCNIPSLGANRSVSTGYSNNRDKQAGYLSHCDLVQSVSNDSKTQAMRMISAKVILASRIDYSNRSSSVASNSFGMKWREEIVGKLDKLQAPPQNAGQKPLPLPVNPPAKKRGGRRFRKYKEQFEMSELAKAQNKMAFAEQEETRMDAFGEEIGMGMIGKFASGGSYRAIENKNATNAKLSKAMNSRLQNSKMNGATNSIADTLIGNEKLLTFQEATEKYSSAPLTNARATNSSNWLSGGPKGVKRPADVELASQNHKRLSK